MTGAEVINKQQFDVARIPAPPALLAYQLRLAEKGLGDSSGALLLQNPALLLRVIDAHYRVRGLEGKSGLEQRLEKPDITWLHSLLTDSSLQLVLGGNKTNQLFHQYFWQQSRLCSLLTQALAKQVHYPQPTTAAITGLLLHCGMLVLEQEHQQNWFGLFAETPTQHRLLEAETQTLGSCHIDAGVHLLQSWELGQDCLDAVRYQAQPLEQILDATQLVRISWLANLIRLENLELTPQVSDAANALFGLSFAQVEALLHNVALAYRHERNDWGASDTTLAPLPLSDQDLLRFQQDNQEQIEALQSQLLTESALAALESSSIDTAEALRAIVARALQQAAIDPRFIVLTAGRDEQTLRVKLSNKIVGMPAELSLQMSPSRNAISSIIAAGELATLSEDTESLTVIDRQLMSLLGGANVLCDPQQTESGRLVLLLPGNSAYPAQPLTRQFIKRKLATFLTQQQVSAVPLELLLYQQRVRESVHEANNPLAIIKNYLQILSIKLGEQGASKEIKLINTEIDRVAGILAALRRTENVPAELTETDLNLLLLNMHKVFAEAFSADNTVKIRLDLTSEPTRCWGKADALKQIITNLVKNAAEAFGNGGTIVISTKHNVFAQEKLYVQLNIADNGPGISAKVMQRLFESGNTTKGEQHSGAGLAIVKKLIDEMDGQINCQSDSNGTIFNILLPQIT